MNKLRATANAAVIMLFVLASASFVRAQETRTWVSGNGNDLNPCTRALPCKTLVNALSRTVVGGEIDVLDPVSTNGPIFINKSVTIDGTGSFGSILASGTTALNINIPVSTSDPLRVVRIRGFSINGATSCGPACGTGGIIGVNVYGAGANAVYVEDSVIDNFSNGINVVSTSPTASDLHLRNVTIRNCTNAGVIIRPSMNVVVLAFDNVNITRSPVALNVQNGGRGAITRSYFGNSGGFGIMAASVSILTDLSVSETTFTGLGTGIWVSTNAHVRIARCVITGNTYSLAYETGGLVDTGLNNSIMGNALNRAPNGSPFTQQ